MRAVSSGTGGTGCGRRSDMGDLWTRKSSNAMAPHKAADFANGVRSFAAHWLHHFSACKHVPSQSRVGFVSSSSRPRPSRAATPFEGCDLPGTVDTYEAPRLHTWGFSFQHDRLHNAG